MSWNSHGRLIFAGRADTQLKIRGQRVELGAIEFHIRQFLSPPFMLVAEVIQISTTKDSGYSSQRLMVILSSHNRKEDVDVATEGWKRFTKAKHEEIKRHLTQALPSYMVPSSILELDRIPLMPSGKIDCKRLRELAVHAKLEESEQTGTSRGAADRL